MAKLSVKVVAIVLAAVEGFVLLLLCIATAIGQFKRKEKEYQCFTLWGYKSDCGNTKYTSTGVDAFGCPQRRDFMTAGAALSIVEIACVLGAFLWGILLIAGAVRGLLAPAILTLVGAIVGIVPWTMVAVVYHEDMCRCSNCSMGGKFKDGYDYDAGFILFLVAWCCHVGVTILVCIAFFG